MTRAVIITIDGPAGTGKSTVAHRLACRLGLDFLDTGAMYRAAALVAVEQELDPAEGPAVAEAVRAAGMRFDWTSDPPRIHLGDRDVSDRIRDMDVSAVVSTIAAQRALRDVLVAEQRRIASEHPRLVSEGRDQGSVVFPDASIRFFLKADVAVRAKRRVAQLAAAGKQVDEQEVIEDIRRRDRTDSTRQDGPLHEPEGAVVVDASDRTADEVVDLLERTVRRELPEVEFES
jgi:cytidylate kinase